MVKRNQKNKNKKMLWFVLSMVIFVPTLTGFVWYNYVYNPLISAFKDINSQDLSRGFYKVCLDEDEYAKSLTGMLNLHYCACIANDLGSQLANNTIRKQEFKRKQDAIITKCKSESSYSELPATEIKKIYVNNCLGGVGAHQKKYCECWGNNVAYYMKQYSYESAIVLNYDHIVKKAAKDCAGHIKK